MIKKRDTCLYCGEKMDSKTAKKKFCSEVHRVYYNRENGTKNPIKIQDLTKPTGVVKSEINHKSNVVIDTRPKNLDQLKLMCPEELSGFDRSEWIRENRLKFKI